jgi:3-deoxy-manno-octulosonate cytidylyltransferase (CMP-KDO synthetase)
VGYSGQKSNQKVIAVIPARYHSTRLPGKMLLPIAGKPLIVHTAEQAMKVRNVDRVIVATDDVRIKIAVEKAGMEAVMTAPEHRSGSDRIAEVAKKFKRGTIVVNVQGDEPLISPLTIEKAVKAMLGNPDVDIVTCAEQIKKAVDVLDPNVVKVVTDAKSFAMYFSRSPIPYLRSEKSLKEILRMQPDLIRSFKKHVGLYVYRREYLLKYTKMKQTAAEKLEMLEQLRALENGGRIKVIEIEGSAVGVDTKKDYLWVKKFLESK